MPGVSLSERDLTTLAFELAVRGVDRSDGILAEQRDRIENADRRNEFEFVMPALADDMTVRDRFFGALADPAGAAPWPATIQKTLVQRRSPYRIIGVP